MNIFNRKRNNNPKQEHYWGHFSTVGRRENQEDSWLITEEFKGKRLFLVADGLGGLEYGEFASKQVIEVYQNFFVQIDSFASPDQFLQRTALVAASMLMNKSMEDEKYKNCGTTLTGFLLDNNKYYTINIGDSRVYLYSKNTLTQLTKDQSFVQNLIDKGLITKEEAFTHPKKNLVTSIISGSISNMKVDISKPRELSKGDILIACSDGLHDALTDEQIKKIIDKNKNNKNLAEILGKAAFDAGSRDNITVCFYKK